MAARIIRRATTGDVEPLAEYIAQANAEPERQCLHTPGSRRRTIREALSRGGGLDEGEFVFVLAASPGSDGPGEITGAFGCQWNPHSDAGWLWGPWGSPETVWAELLAELLRVLPGRLRRLDGFLNVANHAGLRLLRQNGFSLRSPTHIYVAPAEAAVAAEAAHYPELAARHEVGFARLHRETFPAAGSTPAEELLAGRNDERVIFAAADDLRLLGYICASVNVAPREGFIDYLAVRPAARGRGIGQRLLQTALHWAVVLHGLPQMALCVTEWRDDARRLYERAGFRLSATGRGVRRQLR